MLTRLKVSGFKNLVDVDISFGPFTCIAGANGAGKSNLFDAISFLSNLSDNTLIEAAYKVRNEGGRGFDVRNIFHRLGDSYDNTMSFEAEMIIPGRGIDDLGQEAQATVTFLRYSLALQYQIEGSSPSLGSIKILKEELDRIKLRDFNKRVKFPYDPEWKKSVIEGQRRSKFISTDEGNRIIKLHDDKGKAGMARSYKAADMPRTVLSRVNASENPTALLARREMQSWRIQQLEPATIRDPDSFNAPVRLSIKGAHLPAALEFLARSFKNNNSAGLPPTWIYDQLASRLAELIQDVDTVRVDRDEKRDLLTLMVKDRNQTELPANCLSDGTLRFLALSLLELDSKSGGLICFEEPENGIHPERISAMIRLLQLIAMDSEEPVNEDNPFRQVIINTHSPVVVANVPDDSLLIAELRDTVKNKHHFKSAEFSWLPDTWRHRAFPEVHPVAKGNVLSYLNSLIPEENENSSPSSIPKVAQRKDIARWLPGMEPRNE